MGFWDWLTGKPDAVRVEDVVWISPEAKLGGLCRQARDEAADADAVVLVAHFPETLARVRRECEQAGLPVTSPGRRLSPAEFRRLLSQGGEGRVIAALAEELAPDEFPDPATDELSPLPILVAERHFLRPRDDAVVAFARGLGRPCRVRFHTSLQDPLVRVFAGERVGAVLSRLGLTETDAIESPLVDRQIQRAQAVFARQVDSEQNADSAEDWLRINVGARP